MLAARAAREHGATWSELGEPLGLSKQGARRRHLAIDPIFARRPRRPPTIDEYHAEMLATCCALSDHLAMKETGARSMQGIGWTTPSRASRCGTIRSATRTSGRSGCTRRRAERRRPCRLRAPGSTGQLEMAQPGRVPADLPRVARPRGRRRAHRLRRCLHLRRRLPVRRSERERPLPHLPLRRDRSVRRRPLRLERLPRRRRQVKRRPGRRRDRDAPARSLPRPASQRRRRASSRCRSGPSSASRRGGCATPTAARSRASSTNSTPGRRRSRNPDDLHVLLQWGFAAAYSADEDGTIRLPYDVATAQVIPELWERWLEWDYPTLVPRHADELRGLRPSTSTSAHATTGTST